MIQEFPVFLLTPHHTYCASVPVQSGSSAPSWAVWLQSYFGDMPHAPAFRWLRSYRAKCNAEIQINFKKIQRRYSSSCSTSHCSHSESRVPAFAPLFKLPSASHRGNRPFSVTSPLFIYKGKTPLSGRCLPFTPGAVWRNARDDSPARERPAIGRMQKPEYQHPRHRTNCPAQATLSVQMFLHLYTVHQQIQWLSLRLLS